MRVLTGLKATALFGYGSPAAILAKIFLDLNKIEECWVLPVDAPEAAAPWRKTFTVSVTAAQQGAAAITVNGAKIDAAAVDEGASAGETAAAIAARINSGTRLPVEAETGADGEFTVKSAVAGSGGSFNSVTITIEAAGATLSEGAVTPDAQAANPAPLFPGPGSVRYSYIVSDFADADNSIGNPPALPGDSKGLTFTGVEKLSNLRIARTEYHKTSGWVKTGQINHDMKFLEVR